MEGNAGRREPQDLDQQRRAMLAALEEAVLGEDYDFATQIASTQELLGPTDLIEYMDVKRRGAEDPVEQRRWDDGIHDYWSTLQVHQFTPDEIERLEAVKQRMEFDSIVGNDEVAEVTEVAEETDLDEVEERSGWVEDRFYVDLEEEEIDEVGNLVVFRQAVQAATGIVPNLDEAINIIDKVSGPLQEKMRLILDWYVFENAVQAATGIVRNLDRGVEIVETYASDSDKPSEVTERMRLALDKYVFAEAKQAATGIVPNVDRAAEIIQDYASSPERAKAMLRELGFM